MGYIRIKTHVHALIYSKLRPIPKPEGKTRDYTEPLVPRRRVGQRLDLVGKETYHGEWAGWIGKRKGSVALFLLVVVWSCDQAIRRGLGV
jgi:hypothetical protein